jgi:Domain of unknown function (DUF4384)
MFLRKRMVLTFSAIGLCLGVGFAWSQSTQQLSAREIFYGPAREKAAAGKKPADAKGAKPAQRGASAQNSSKPPAAEPDTSVEAKTPDPQVRKDSSQGTVPVTLATYTRKPLGIRLSVVKMTANGPMEASPDTSFQPGDRVQLNIEVSDDGYLYIINRGSSGTWTQLFPSPDLPNATNMVVPGMTYSVPPDRNFVVSDPPGEEKLFIILSRMPELDIAALTLDLSRKEGGSPAPKESPSAPAPRQQLTTLTENLPPMNDAMVDQLRKMYARDLIIETVDDKTPGTRKENAVYAVSTGDGNDTRVVLDAQIKHK